MTKHLNVSMPAVSQDVALELMAHHLQLAHVFFQLVPGDRAQNREELVRLLMAQYVTPKWVDDGGLGHTEMKPYWPDAPELTAALAWLDHMEAVYEEMKQDD